MGGTALRGLVNPLSGSPCCHLSANTKRGEGTRSRKWEASSDSPGLRPIVLFSRFLTFDTSCLLYFSEPGDPLCFFFTR